MAPWSSFKGSWGHLPDKSPLGEGNLDWNNPSFLLLVTFLSHPVSNYNSLHLYSFLEHLLTCKMECCQIPDRSMKPISSLNPFDWIINIFMVLLFGRIQSSNFVDCPTIELIWLLPHEIQAKYSRQVMCSFQVHRIRRHRFPF